MAFFRQLTEEERVDAVQLGKVSPMQIFLKELAKKVSEYQLQYKPYDSYCARLDFEDSISKKYRDIDTSVGVTAANYKIDLSGLDEYGDTTRFVFIERTTEKEDKLLDGIRQPTIIGYRYKFKSKIKGNGITVFVPINKEEDDKEFKEMEKFIAEYFSEKINFIKKADKKAE